MTHYKFQRVNFIPLKQSDAISNRDEKKENFSLRKGSSVLQHQERRSYSSRLVRSRMEMMEFIGQVATFWVTPAAGVFSVSLCNDTWTIHMLVLFANLAVVLVIALFPERRNCLNGWRATVHFWHLWFIILSYLTMYLFINFLAQESIAIMIII